MSVLAQRGWMAWALALIVLLAAGCKPPRDNAVPPAAGQGAGGLAAKTLQIVATTAMIADVAREIGGSHAAVTTLMGEGVDPHLYKASPGDIRLMSDADLILYNGLHLEGRMADVIVKMAASGGGAGGKRTVVQVTDRVDEKKLREPPEFAGHYDPHVWFDVEIWNSAAARIRDALTEKDPANQEAYGAAYIQYGTVLAELHQYAKDAIASIPKERRLLVTAHDAFGYFGAAYGIEVRGIQGISTDSEASLQDINALVDTLVTRKVPAVFVESSVPRKTIEALVEGCSGRGHTIAIGGELFSDAMGKPGTLKGTYVGMVLHNVESITRALGGTLPASRPGRLGEYASRHSAAAPKAGGGGP